VLAAAFASCLPRSTHWPLPCGLGGVIGDAILRLPVLLFHVPLRGGNSVIAAIVLGGAAALAIAVASGLFWRDADADDDAEADDAEERSDRDRDRGWISLGWLAHSLLSLRARLALLFGARKRRPMPSADVVSRARIEPRFAVGEEGDDEAVDEEDDTPRPARKPRSPRPRRSNFSTRRAGSAAPPCRARFCRKTPSRSKAYWPISACAAKSSMRGPGRW
jgi:S-DNA-T family DNA segregation ATPase FtsK/SpoIIIE